MRSFTTKRFRLVTLLPLVALAACGPELAPAPPDISAESNCVITDKGRRCFVVSDGLAITGGDIILGSADDLLAAARREGTRDGEAFWLTSTNPWPGGVVPYVIQSGFSSMGLSRIQSAMNDYATHTNIRWVQRTTQSDYVVWTPNTNGCDSWVGRVGGAQVLNLDPDATCAAAHEMGHAVGFEHEHQRPDRDSYITVRYENIESGLNSQFDIVSGGDISNPYDIDSVMQYYSYAFSANGKPTMLTKNGGLINYQYSLSAEDIAILAVHYPNPPMSGCTRTTCAQLGANCGSVSDGCGGTLDCGSCSNGETCGGGGHANVCGGGTTSTCQYTCASFHYTAGQCASGWLCDGNTGCLQYVGTCSATNQTNCQYSCSSYGFTANQCYQGWTCDAQGQCLHHTGGC